MIHIIVFNVLSSTISKKNLNSAELTKNIISNFTEISLLLFTYEIKLIKISGYLTYCILFKHILNVKQINICK